MEALQFRTLTADEIECRVAQTGSTAKGAWCSLLLYKDARCDQRLLDETVGCFRWARKHEIINGNLFCTVSIKDESGEWVSKQDVGVESNTEKEKGQASDSFKRACFNWGLGRELYTAPKIFIQLYDTDYSNDNGKIKVKVAFRVSNIEYDDKRNIVALSIVDQNGAPRYTFPAEKLKPNKGSLAESKEEEWIKKARACGSKNELMEVYKQCPEALKAKGGKFWTVCSELSNELQ